MIMVRICIFILHCRLVWKISWRIHAQALEYLSVKIGFDLAENCDREKRRTDFHFSIDVQYTLFTN